MQALDSRAVVHPNPDRRVPVVRQQTATERAAEPALCQAEGQPAEVLAGYEEG